MKNSLVRRIVVFKVALLSVCVSVPALAQYSWIGPDNVRNYSDTAPPSSVPERNILKKPAASGKGSVTYEAVVKDQVANAKLETVPAARLPLTAADKNADFQKRKMEQAEKDKKAEEEAKIAAEKAKFCERNQAYLKALESGQRVAQTDKNGVRSVLNDEQRAHELQEVRSNLEKCK